MTKHTPGPWKFCRENGSPTTGQYMISGGKSGYLAEVRDCGSGDVIANANLMASAPDLLKALKAMMKIDPTKEDWELAHAALTKAEGK